MPLDVHVHVCDSVHQSFLSPAALKARDGRYWNAPPPPSVCPSRLVFALLYFLETLHVPVSSPFPIVETHAGECDVTSPSAIGSME